MMTYATVTVEAEVDVDLSQFDTSDLLEELKERGREGLTFADSQRKGDSDDTR